MTEILPNPSNDLIRQWLFPTTIAILCFFIIGFGDEARLWLRFSRDDIAAGQWWRLLTGHFAHVGWNHLLLNIAGLFLVTWLQPFVRSLKEQTVIWGLASVSVGLALFLFEQHLNWYVGLSGVLHCFFLILFVDIFFNDRLWGALLLSLGLAKIAFEQYLGPSESTAQLIGATVVIQAHFYGCCAGLCYLLLSRFRQPDVAKKSSSQGSNHP